MELHSFIFGYSVILVTVGCILSREVAANFTFCAYHDNSEHIGKGETGYIDEAAASLSMIIKDKLGIVQPDRKTIKCDVKNNKCYSLWQTDPGTNIDVIVKQGCWDHSDPYYCDKDACMNDRRPMRNSTKFCCCAGDMCNTNFTDIYVPSADDASVPQMTPGTSTYPNYRQNTIIIALSSVISVAIISALSFLIYRLWISSQKPSPDSLHLVEAPPSPSYELDQLKLDSLIQKGRYGEIWKGQLNDKDVAVKIFSAVQRSYFINERDIYLLPYMDHDSLLKFYGAQDRVLPDGAVQYMIVIQLCPEGSLIDYLKHNTLDWLVLCRMCHSIASGLAHLHTDIKKSDKLKPVVAHRDFNTRNILVKPDLTCVICDFGFAMKLSGTRLYRGQDEEQVSLIDVGTLRYMAPEVLDGAVNLRDCESSLKQIDIYALGLVIWEIASRCTDLYQGMPVPEHALPFHHELGAHPSLEQMQLMVSRKKMRPIFPDVWKDTHQAIRALKETIEECWDQDAEARLTAMCVEERILEMTNLWEAVKYKGVTPTILQTGMLPDSLIMQRNVTTSQISPASQAQEVHSESVTDKNGNLAPTEQSRMLPHVDEYVSSSYQPYHRFHNMTDQSVSTSTTDTTLTMSPSEPEVYSKATRNISYARSNRMNQPLQPHQGRNPTVERNTHKKSDEEFKIKGNTLVEGGVSLSSSSHSLDHIFDTHSDNVDSSLVQNEILNQGRPNHPIPYVVNRVNAEPMVVRPKQANVPGNGQTHRQGSSSSKPLSKIKKWKEKGKFSLFGRSLVIRGILGGYRKKDKGGDPMSQPLQTPTAQTRVEPCYNPEKCNLLNEAEYKTVATKVCLMNGSPVVRPLDLQLPSNRSEDDTTNINLLRSHEGRLGVAEIGVAKLQSANNGHAAVVRLNSSSVGSSRSESSSDDNLFENGSLQRRPSSLSLNGHNYMQNDLKSDGNVSTQSTPSGNDNRKVTREELTSALRIKRRIKTPYTLRPGRFSLYDDRMMSDSCREMLGKAKPDHLMTKSSISLQQFNNGDVDLDALKAADFTC